MSGSLPFPRSFFRFSKVPPQIAYALGLGPLIGRAILLLTTTGRRSGLPRVTPLQYEQIGEAFYLGSAMGTRADWYRNLEADPHVGVRVQGRRFRGTAETFTDPEVVADFLEYRLLKHPRMVRAIARSAGLPRNYTREDLEAYARGRALVIVRPVQPFDAAPAGPGSVRRRMDE